MISTLNQPCASLLFFMCLTTFPTFAAESDKNGAESSQENSMETITVTATRQGKSILETAASVTHIDKEAIDNQGFAVGSDELRHQPGIFFRRGSGDNDDFLIVNIRGIEGTHGHGVETFLGMIDGIPYLSGDEEVLISEIPYDAVESIEVVRGPMSALYGRGGIAGAVNYRLKQPQGSKVKLNMSTGSEAFRKTSVYVSRELNERHGMMANVSYEEAEGWRIHNDRDHISGLLRGVSRLNDRLQADWNIAYMDKSYKSGSVLPMSRDGRILVSPDTNTDFIGSREDLGRQVTLSMTSLRVEYKILPQVQWHNTLHYRDIDNQYAYDLFDTRFMGVNEAANTYSVQGFDSASQSDTLYLDSQLRFNGENNTLIVGLNYEEVNLNETDYWTGQFGFTPECGFMFFVVQINYETGERMNGDHPCFQEKMAFTTADTRNRFEAVYLQNEYTFLPGWQLTAGGRFDRFARRTLMQLGPNLVPADAISESRSNFSPMFSIRRQFRDKHFIYLSYGEGFNSNFGPVWQWDPANYVRDIEPTVLKTREIGIKGIVDAYFSYALSAFSLSQSNRKILTPNPDRSNDPSLPGTLVIGGDKYQATGLEVSLSAHWSEKLHLQSSYSYIDPEWRQFEIVTESGTSINLNGVSPVGVPEHMFSGSMHYQWSNNWQFYLAYEFYDDYFFTQDNRQEGGAYDLWTAAFGYTPLSEPNLKLNLSIANLTDKEYYFLFGERENATYATPGIPRQFRLSISYEY